MLVFFFSLTLFFFFTWISKHQDRALILSCLSLGVGFLAKYQVLVAGIVMISGILLLNRDKLRLKFTKFLLVPIIAVAVVVPWLVVLYQTNGVNNFGQLFYAIREGGEDRAQYSARFPAPVFYLIEMTWPFNDVPVHPISLPLYVLGLLGICLLAWRRKPEDKFFLAWFAVVYVFFTLVSVGYSSNDAYQMVARDQIHIPIAEAADYAINRMRPNDSLMVLCAINLFNQDMVKFYLQAADGSKQNEVLQYPELPVDAFTPSFNVTELVGLCRQKSVKYVFLYEYGGDFPYFLSNLNAMKVYEELTVNNSGNFTDEYRVGISPRTITIFSSP